MKQKYPIVEVVWQDAECNPTWTSIEKIKEGKLPIIRTIGFLLHEDDEKLIVASTIGGDEVNATMMIPADWVTKVWYIMMEKV